MFSGAAGLNMEADGPSTRRPHDEGRSGAVLEGTIGNRRTTGFGMTEHGMTGDAGR